MSQICKMLPDGAGFSISDSECMRRSASKKQTSQSAYAEVAQFDVLKAQAAQPLAVAGALQPGNCTSVGEREFLAHTTTPTGWPVLRTLSTSAPAQTSRVEFSAGALAIGEFGPSR
jgi:hypothetical protein